jgi:hypothetical protein
MIIGCRNGVSSCEIARTIGCKQQSAWHVLHRARAIIAQCHDGKFRGTIEADVTVVGGLLKNMHADKRAKNRGTGKGTYIKGTPKHLDAYVNEAVYRFNIRHVSEWTRFDGAMRRIVGKRLTYTKLTDGAAR